MKALVFSAVATFVATVFGGGYGFKPLYYGWDVGLATPEQVLKHADGLNKLPISGLILNQNRRVRSTDGKVRQDPPTFNAPRYEKADFAQSIASFRGITAYPNLKQSFVVAVGQPYGKVRFRWDDDAEWARIAHNFGVLAAVAKEGGLRGLCVDNEDYHGLKQFRHKPEIDGDWETVSARVRQRGREVFSEIFKAYPEITLLYFWTFIDDEEAHLAADPAAALKKSGRLSPAWFNGMLDVMPMTATFIEGNENAYTYEAFKGDFERHAVEVLSDMVKVVAPENRAKYRALVRNSYGIFLDEFTMGPTRVRKGKAEANHWYRGPRNGSRAEHFREIAESAARNCDEYLWFYGEGFSAIDWGNDLDQSVWSLKFDQRTTWETKIGLFSKLALLQGGDEYVRRRVPEIRATGTEPNLLPVTDLSFSADGSNVVTKSFTFVDMTNSVPYVLDARVKGDVRLAAYWLKNGRWCLDVSPEWFVEAAPVGEKDADGWQRVTALVRSSKNVDRLSVQFTVKSGEGCFKGAALYRFDTDAPSGRYAPEASGSAATILACPRLKKELDAFPEYWRIDGDVMVVQKTSQFFDEMVELDESTR